MEAKHLICLQRKRQSLTAVASPLSFSLQIDLEPEGKVFVIIDLSGSTGEGRI